MATTDREIVKRIAAARRALAAIDLELETLKANQKIAKLELNMAEAQAEEHVVKLEFDFSMPSSAI